MLPTGTLDDLADYLVHGYNDWHDPSVGWHSFDDGLSGPAVITFDISGLTAAGQRLARAAMQAWETVADIDFRPAGVEVAQLAFDDAQDGAFAGADWVIDHWITAASVNVGRDVLAEGTTLDSYAFYTYLHEVGHALGLGHLGRYNGDASYDLNAVFANDSTNLSVMSYFSELLGPGANPTDPASPAWSITPMMADIIAIQALYGPARGGVTAGDTTWCRGMSTDTVLGRFFAAVIGERPDATLLANAPTSFTIWDEGGHDVIDLGFALKDQRVDLRSEHFSDLAGRSRAMSIARGTVIEDFVAGAGDDRVTGNAAANGLQGGAGHDALRGLGGGDRLHGGPGQDRLYGGPGQDQLDGGTRADHLFGGSGNDRLRGEYGDDHLVGGAGDDALRGGAGADVFVLDAAGGADRVWDFQDDRDTLRLDDSLWGGGLTVRQVVAAARTVEDHLVFDWDRGSLSLWGIGKAALLDDLVIA